MTEARHYNSLQNEVSALAAVYKFVLNCNEKKSGSAISRPDDAKGSKNDRARISIPKQ